MENINAIKKAIYGEKYEILSLFLNIFAVIILLIAVIIPIALIAQIHEYILNDNPAVVIVPIYFGLVILIFAALCYMISVILNKPSNKNQWLQNTLNALGIIIIILGVITFFITLEQTSGTISELSDIGVVGGIVIIIVHGLIGLLCIGMASIHEKYNADSPKLKIAINRLFRDDDESIFCSACGNEAKDRKSEFCEECGNKL